MTAIGELTDGVVALRPVTDAHVDDMFAAAKSSIPEVSPWLAWCHAGLTRSEIREFARHARRARDLGTEYYFAIQDPETGTVIGGCGINGYDRTNRFANLGYWVQTARAGNGVATRSARLLASWAFSALELERIEIVAAVDNVPSQRVAERLGAQREGVLRRRIRVHDDQQDVVMFSLVRDDRR